MSLSKVATEERTKRNKPRSGAAICMFRLGEEVQAFKA